MATRTGRHGVSLRTWLALPLFLGLWLSLATLHPQRGVQFLDFLWHELPLIYWRSGSWWITTISVAGLFIVAVMAGLRRRPMLGLGCIVLAWCLTSIFVIRDWQTGYFHSTKYRFPHALALAWLFWPMAATLVPTIGWTVLAIGCGVMKPPPSSSMAFRWMVCAWVGVMADLMLIIVFLALMIEVRTDSPPARGSLRHPSGDYFTRMPEFDDWE